jgi:hypothetical protein
MRTRASARRIGDAEAGKARVANLIANAGLEFAFEECSPWEQFRIRLALLRRYYYDSKYSQYKITTDLKQLAVTATHLLPPSSTWMKR